MIEDKIEYYGRSFVVWRDEEVYGCGIRKRWKVWQWKRLNPWKSGYCLRRKTAEIKAGA